MTNLPSDKFKATAPVIGIVGWKNSGKTLLIVRLVEEFSRRGLRVTTIKHAHHNLRLDDNETDSARHRRAGARQVAVVSSRRWAIITEDDTADELDFTEVLDKLDPCDLIIVEGYKSQPIAKIEVRRQQAKRHDSLALNDPNIIAIATELSLPGETLPNFQLDDISAIADFIDQTILQPES